MWPNALAPRDLLEGYSGGYPTRPRKLVSYDATLSHDRPDEVFSTITTATRNIFDDTFVNVDFDEHIVTKLWEAPPELGDITAETAQATIVLDDLLCLLPFQHEFKINQEPALDHFHDDQIGPRDELGYPVIVATPDIVNSHLQTPANSSPSKVSPGRSSQSSLVVLTPGDDSRSISLSTSSERGAVVSSDTPSTEQLYREAAISSSGPSSNTWKLPQWRPRKPKKTATKPNMRKRGHDSINEQGRRGPFTNPEQREETALTRKFGACIRCKSNKIRCKIDQHDPSGLCLTCQEVSGPERSTLNCYRYTITDTSLYRGQDAPYHLFTKRWQNMDLVDIQDWASDEVKTITVSQIFLDAPYEVKVKEFVPQEGDMLEDHWYQNGQMSKYSIPRYALADLEETAAMLEGFIDSNIVVYIGGAVSRDPIIWETYEMAFKHLGDARTQQEQDLILDTFRLWVACRKTSNPHHICGSEKLGAPIVKDPGSLFDNVVPMPVIMIAQMELIMYSRVLRPMSQKVLRSLETLVKGQKPCFWYTIYLCCFMLLHSCAMQTKRDEETAKQYKLKHQFANPASIQAQHSGAHTILGHWHYVIKASQPFLKALTSQGLDEVQTTAGLTDAQARFISRTAHAVCLRDEALKHIRHWEAFGNDWYWVSQLYDEAWVPGPTAR